MELSKGEYIEVTGNESFELVEKKSRFIARIFKIKSESQAEEIIASLKKEFWDARHNCYAYIVDEGMPIQRFSDDGEPQGTAGKPILEVLVGTHMCNTLIVVTRYFGGVLLGTGGLVRAYQGAAAGVLKKAEKAVIREGVRFTVDVPYTLIGKVKYYLGDSRAVIDGEEYTDIVKVTLKMPADVEDKVIKDLTEIFGGEVVKSDYAKEEFVEILSDCDTIP